MKYTFLDVLFTLYVLLVITLVLNLFMFATCFLLHYILMEHNKTNLNCLKTKTYLYNLKFNVIFSFINIVILMLQGCIDGSVTLISLYLVSMFESKENPIHKRIKLKITTKPLICFLILYILLFD